MTDLYSNGPFWKTVDTEDGEGAGPVYVAVDPAYSPKPYDELTSHECSFLVGEGRGREQMACGRPTDTGSIYCGHHRAQAARVAFC
ncbi:hypothetical protein ACFFUB_00345 [Algimonas porphyrae]|uniref:Uncharacterized protein n=1 Tax=Algimonas porphyrae TaxID=1128113 RepID=A0ABQ5UYV9_9PROT|nr:hypothetical protein [Algimonas porphyrae]GLQ20478.1 hypothetical protein GCM10007854_14330 [Algimonas porphyrae]